MRINSFEDIIAWQKSKQLAVKTYTLTKNTNDYGYNGQIQRACVSIMNNIAEGFERKSNKEFKQFLYIAKGSCGEVRSMIRLGEELDYINSAESKSLINDAAEISKMLSGLIKTL